MTPVTWWTGTRMVAGRAISDAVASKSWRIVTAVMLLLGIAFIIVPRLLGEGTTSYRVAVAQGTDPAIPAALEQAASIGGFDIRIDTLADPALAEAEVGEGTADAALVIDGPEATLYVAVERRGSLPALLSQVVLAQQTTQAMLDAGLTPQQVGGIQSIPPPQQVLVGRVANEARSGVGFAVGIVLYVALIMTGQLIAAAVATEKSTRISEVLLAVLRPSQLLVGTVLGVGLLGLAQISALGIPVVIGLFSGGGLSIPTDAAGDIALGLVWFVLGMALYAFVYAALATLVEKVTEVGTATMPVSIVLIASYLLAVTVGIGSPTGWPAVAGSMFPLSAPMVMPVRWASGLVPPWQLGLSMALTALTAVLLAGIASRVYARGLTMSGRRVKLREALHG